MSTEIAVEALKIPPRAQTPSDGPKTGAKVASRAEFQAMPEWERLAHEAGVRLPQFATPLTTARMKRWLRKMGIEYRDYCAWDGSRKAADFIARNPAWTCRAWCGLVLEHRHLMVPTSSLEVTPT